jgi:nucleoid DNA-binding protein
MASKIKAIGAYRPRIEQGNTVQKPELIRAVSRATGLVEGSLDQGIKELSDQVIEYCRAGRAVKVEGLGTWAPNITLDGTFDIQYRADTALTNGLNIPGVFTGTIRNREHIGKTPDELVARWNT